MNLKSDRYLSQYSSQEDREVNSAVDLSCFADHLESINVSTALEPFIRQHSNNNKHDIGQPTLTDTPS